ncbi:hypothetical protein DMA11_24585, partial [Marinilabiliaceae bacterium JC017]
NGREQLFSGDPETLPVHKVTLDSYSMQRYEVSIKEFDIYTKAIGEDRIMETFREEPYAKPEYAAKCITWYQARNYCLWLGE